jgi:Domain of unknown function (DUF309).
VTALPPFPHLPGRNSRPDPAFFAPLLDGLAGLGPAALTDSAAFRMGFAAYAAGYYWESHEVWEPVWAALPPASAERHLLRGLIQLANAGLKRRMGREAAALRILALADSALAEAFGGGRRLLMGMTPDDVAGLRRQAIAEIAL